MAFYEDVRLPIDVERGVKGGPRFRTTILPLRNGFEKRLKNWSRSRGQWNVGYGISNMADLDGVLDVFYNAGGSGDGFRFRDWSDYQIGDTLTPDITTRQLIGVTDTVNADFQIFKARIAASHTFTRIINKPVIGTTRLWVNDVEITEGAGVGEFVVDTTTGIITIGSTLVAQSATDVAVMTQFDIPVRFASDELDIDLELAYGVDGVGSIPNIGIEEIRV